MQIKQKMVAPHLKIVGGVIQKSAFDKDCAFEGGVDSKGLLCKYQQVMYPCIDRI